MPNTQTAYDTVLALDPGRSAAVFGAPGSGKTTLAVDLVADRVERLGFSTDEVLVLSSNRVTATQLRDAIAIRLGIIARGPLARTANSIAFQLVREYTGRAVTLLTGAEHDQLIGELVDAAIVDGGGPAWPEAFAPEVRTLRGFRAELRDLMMRASEHGVDSDELRRLAHTTDRPEWAATAAFIDEYADIKEQVRGGQYDSSELAAFAASIVQRSRHDERAERALGLLAEVRLVIVDDAQEATEGTAALLAGFAARGVAVIALGDPDVASNGFRGGRPEVLGSFGSTLGVPVQRIELDRVLRSRPQLRELTQQITAHIGTALGGTHRTARVAHEDDDSLAPLLGVEALSHAGECQAVASILRERHLLDGVPWGSMAVVMRSGSDVPAFERGLATADVPTNGGAARAALRDVPAARALLTAASIALERHELDAESAIELLTGPLGGLDRVGIRRLRLALRHEELAAGGDRTGDVLLVEALEKPGRLETIDAAPARRAARLATLLATTRGVATVNGTVEEILWSIWERSGLAKEWASHASATGVLADEANRALDGVVALFAAAQRFVEREPASPAVRFVDDQLASELPEDSLAPQRRAETVLVTTPAALIGRSFDVVVIAGLQEGVWPNLRPRGTLLHAERLASAVSAARTGAPQPTFETAAETRASVRNDELRLFALAVSRATRQLVFSCTANDDEQPSMLMAYARERVRPNRRRPLHLRGLVGALRREAAAAAHGEAPAALSLLVEAGVPGAHPDEWYGLAEPSTTAPLVELDSDPEAVVAVSPSQIEAAETSPLGWFIDHVGASPSSVAASIGTIVHAVVEEVSLDPDAPTTPEHLWAAVERRLAGVQLEPGWVGERDRRGARTMATGAADYLTTFADDAKVLMQAEGRFTLTVGRMRINGTIDRVEASPDGTTVIVDLKTGRTPPSANDTSVHPQLSAYQLAARRDSVPNNGVLGGAKLVFLAKPKNSEAYTERAQQPFDDDADEAFVDRLESVGRIMAGASFEGPGDLGFGSRFEKWQYRVHLVPAVSA